MTRGGRHSQLKYRSETMSVQPIDYLVHFSNLLLLVSYSVRNILWLRWFAVAAALTNMPYFLMQPSILWPPVLWAGVFTAINLYQIWRIYLERRPVILSPDEQALYDMGFHALTPRDFVALVMVGAWRDAAAGDRMLDEGQPVSSVSIAIRGTVRIRGHGRDLGLLEPGHVIGTAMALVGKPSSFDATFTEPGRYITWPLAKVRRFTEGRPELLAALQHLVNQDLARKIERLALA
jgi:CRP-like cAMP-binding protein